MRVGLTVLVSTCLIAIVGYVLAGWSYIDALYMVVITIFGVGYGEVNPVDDPRLKLFTLALIISGCSSAIYVLGGFVQMIAEGEIQRALGARRMSQEINALSGHAIVCGFGRMGRNLIHELDHLGVKFVVIDCDPERLADAERHGTLVIAGDAAQEEILQQAGIERASVLATVLPKDADNVFVTLTARELCEKIQIIARCECPTTERKLIRSGADGVVSPTMIGATRIAHQIACPTVESIVENKQAFNRLNQDLDVFGLRMVEIEIHQESIFVGATIHDLETSGDGATVVVAVKRANGEVIKNPRMCDEIHGNDKLVMLSHQEDLAPLCDEPVCAPIQAAEPAVPLAV
ncbi:potassium channel family protein [Rhodopirellula sp. JC639]|uniref:potassium channel family protein n=1 Tax=Stieleria mannarensis TaxID=2755585 RepID=UPI001C7254F5|nr:potassium channel protein [Rhodopirellula sp. JC639]